MQIFLPYYSHGKLKRVRVSWHELTRKWALSLLLQSLAQISTITVYCIWDVNPGGSKGKESAFSAGELGSISGSGRSPGEGNGSPLHIPAREIPWTEEAGGSQRVRHNWATITSAPRLPRSFGLSYLTFWNSLLRFFPLSLYPLTLQLLFASGSPAHSTMANFTVLQTPLENRLARNPGFQLSYIYWTILYLLQ